MKILFMGTPAFAVPCLKELFEKGHEIAGVVTQPDRPKGRGMKMVFPPVKEYALEHGLKVFQPTVLKDAALQPLLEELKPELIAVTAYGRILPPYIINYPKYGCVNVHASILPRYRGAAPIQWSVINGDKETGVTTMLMDEGLDTGDILLAEKTQIGESETAGELFERLSVMGAKLLLRTIDGLEGEKIVPSKQDGSYSTYAPMITKKDAEISFDSEAAELVNKIRGMNPSPLSWFSSEGRIIKVLKARRLESDEPGQKPGRLLDRKRFIVSCRGGAVELLEVRPEGKSAMSGEEYIRGRKSESDFIWKEE